MQGKISRVGSLVPSHHKDLIGLDLSSYQGFWKGYRYFRRQRTVMGIPYAVVLTLNAVTRRKKEHSLSRGIEKLKKDLQERWNTHR